MNKKKQHRMRLFMTIGLLMAFGAFLMAITAIDISTNSEGISVLGLLIGAPLFTFMISMVWRYRLMLVDEQEQDSTSLEKRKRERIDSVLRDLSDDDLLRLRERLVDGTVGDDMLEEQLIGDDGELMYMENK